MMKLKVLKKFHDKETDALHNAGDVIEVSDERGKEILASKYNVAELLEVGEPDAPQSGTEGESDSEGEPNTPAGENPTGDDSNGEPTDGQENADAEKLEDLTVEQLKAKAKELGIEIKGLKTKEQLLEAFNK